MKAIGGYFELERPNPDWEQASLFPDGDGCEFLSSGRACLRVICACERPRRAWLPYFVCDALLEPFREAGIEMLFYGIDETFRPLLETGSFDGEEFVVCVNYFGLCDAVLNNLERKPGFRVCFDQTQAFFHRPETNSDWHFSSARKWFGVPDGAFLRAPAGCRTGAADLPRFDAYRTEHLILRACGFVEEGYAEFRKYEERVGSATARGSLLSERILKGVGADFVACRRRENYAILAKALGPFNRLPQSMLSLSGDSVPFCYPFLPQSPLKHEALWSRGLFVPQWWRECLEREAQGFAWEKELAGHLLPLPVDQRHGSSDMERILTILDDLGAFR